MERRSVQRVKLSSPTLAALGSQRAFVVDVSTRGFSVIHSSPMSNGRRYVLEATLEGVSVSAECELLRCRLSGKAEDGTPLYQSGLIFRGSDLRFVRSAVAALVASELERSKRARAAVLPHASSATQL